MKAPALLGDLAQRALDAVVDVPHQPRAEVDGEQPSARVDRLAGPQAGGVLVDLHGADVAHDADEFADEPPRADLDDLVHLRAAHADGLDDRAVDARDPGVVPAHSVRSAMSVDSCFLE